MVYRRHTIGRGTVHSQICRINRCQQDRFVEINAIRGWKDIQDRAIDRIIGNGHKGWHTGCTLDQQGELPGILINTPDHNTVGTLSAAIIRNSQAQAHVAPICCAVVVRRDQRARLIVQLNQRIQQVHRFPHIASRSSGCQSQGVARIDSEDKFTFKKSRFVAHISQHLSGHRDILPIR